MQDTDTFIINKTKKNYVRASKFYTHDENENKADVIVGFLITYDVWLESDNIVKANKTIDYVPTKKQYHDISFVVIFSNIIIKNNELKAKIKELETKPANLMNLDMTSFLTDKLIEFNMVNPIHKPSNTIVEEIYSAEKKDSRSNTSSDSSSSESSSSNTDVIDKVPIEQTLPKKQKKTFKTLGKKKAKVGLRKQKATKKTKETSSSDSSNSDS